MGWMQRIVRCDGCRELYDGMDAENCMMGWMQNIANNSCDRVREERNISVIIYILISIPSRLINDEMMEYAHSIAKRMVSKLHGFNGQGRTK